MVSSKAVNDIHIVPESFLILWIDQTRFDLTPTLTYSVKVTGGQEEMMWGHLTGHW